MIRKTKFFPALIAGAFFFAIAIAGCNNSGDSKDVNKDSVTTVRTDSSMMTMPKDTSMKKDTMMKMDTSMKTKPKPVHNP